MITGDKNRNRQRAPAAKRDSKKTPKMNVVDRTNLNNRKAAPITLPSVPSLDRPLPPEDKRG